jgi:CubicO group peptidase (beta-lactamase class C family)
MPTCFASCVEGTCDPRFAAVGDAFAANLDAGIENGAALAIEVDGRLVVDVWGGSRDPARTTPWQRDTLVCAFSCTKGLVATLALLLVERGDLDLDAPVATYWPEFAAAGKHTIPVRWLLTHEAGLAAIDAPLPFGSLSDWDLMITSLAAQAPNWPPGTAHGYHGVTFGHLVGEVVRRVSGRSVGTFLREQLGDDLHIGLGHAEEPRVATLCDPRIPDDGVTFFGGFGPDTLGARAFGNPPDCNVTKHTNSRAFRAAEIPAANAHVTARALARVYGALASRLSPGLLAEAMRPHVDGPDLVMGLPTRFGLGYEVTFPEWRFGPGTRTFGHNGSGGSLGILDPDAGVALGYVMNQLWWGRTRDDPRWAPIFDALYGAL